MRFAEPVDLSVHKARPCPLCARMIIQAGIKNVFLRNGEGTDNYEKIAAIDLEWHTDVTKEIK